MASYKVSVLPPMADPLWVTRQTELNYSEEAIEREEQELAKYYASVTNCESTFVAPGFERKEESEEEEEGKLRALSVA